MARNLVESFHAALVVTEAADPAKNPDVLLRWQAKVGELGRVTLNGRLYPEESGRRQVEKLNARIQERGLRPGQDGHPGGGLFSSQAPTWSGVPGVGVGLKRVWVDQNADVWAEGIVPNTMAGRDVAVCARVGFPICFSSRARGDVTERVMDSSDPDYARNQAHAGKRYARVNDDWDLEAYDLVVDPGVDAAMMRSYHEGLEAGAALEERLRAALANLKEERMSEDLKAKVAALETEKAGLVAEAAKLREAVDARAKELTEKFEADLKAKMAEAAAVAPTADQRALLDRLAKVPADRLEAALAAAEGGKGAPTDADRKMVALEARVETLAKDNAALLRQIRERDEAAARAAERAKLEAHVSRITATLAARKQVREHLLEHCETPEQADAELKKLREFANLEEEAAGLAPGDGNPVGSGAPTDQFRSSDGGPTGGNIAMLEDARARIVAGASGGMGPRKPKAKAS